MSDQTHAVWPEPDVDVKVFGEPAQGYSNEQSDEESIEVVDYTEVPPEAAHSVPTPVDTASSPPRPPKEARMPKIKKGVGWKRKRNIQSIADNNVPKANGWVVTAGNSIGRRYGERLNLFQAFNSLILATILLYTVNHFHLWSNLTLVGAGVGIVATVVELELYYVARDLVERSSRNSKLATPALLVVLIMAGVAVAVYRRWPDDWFTVVVVFGLFTAMADPFGFVYNKSKQQIREQQLDAREQQLDAREQQMIMRDTAAYERIATLAADNNALHNTLLARTSRLEAEYAEKFKTELARYQQEMHTGVQDAISQFIGLSGKSAQLDEQQGAAMAAAERAQALQDHALQTGRPHWTPQGGYDHGPASD